jgi:glutamine amidotransferase
MHHKIVIIDYGVGNVHSVSQALTFLGYRGVISREPDVIHKAAAVVLPGVGAFSEAIINLKKHMLMDVLNDEVLTRRKPLLGICLGMQVLGNSSQESPGYEGLRWIDFNVVEVPKRENLKVPHVGWNTIKVDSQDFLFKNLEEEPHFYFDHSYYADCPDQFVAARCDYGVRFPAVVWSENIVGVQFHPEKSQTNGLKLFRNVFNHFGVQFC